MSEYKIVRLLGEGSFGKCYLCESARDKSMVVIKEINLQSLSDQERKEALGEAKVLEALKHTNIITFREVYKTRQNKLCIVMDFADGGDLAGKVKAQRGVHFPENQILDWFIQIALALKHVHDRKVLHRDIKTQNVFLMKNGTVKLGDFGIAKVLKTTREIARTMVGTPYYLSPEIIENKPYSFKSDVWSLGALLYELCALRPPFDGSSLPQLYMKISRGNFSPIPPQFSKDLKMLVSQMLLVEVNRRPTINQILRTPFIKARISNYLSRSLSDSEFNHTVLHNQYLFDKKEEKKEEVKREVPRRLDDPPPRRPDVDLPRRIEEPAPRRIEEPAPRRIEEPAPRRIEEPAPRRIEEPAPRRIEEPAPRRIEEPAPRRIEEPAPRRLEIDLPKRVEAEPLKRQESDQIKPRPAVEAKVLRWREEGEVRNPLISPRYELRPEQKPVVYQPPKLLPPSENKPGPIAYLPKKENAYEKGKKIAEELRRKKEQEEAAEKAKLIQEQERLRVEKEEKKKAEHLQMLEDISRRRQEKHVVEKVEAQVFWPGMREEDKLHQELVQEMQEVMQEEGEQVHEALLPPAQVEDEDRNDELILPDAVSIPPAISEPLDQTPLAGLEGLRGYLADLMGVNAFELSYQVIKDVDSSLGKAVLDQKLLNAKLRGVVDVERNRSSLELVHTLIYIESLAQQRALL